MKERPIRKIVRLLMMFPFLFAASALAVPIKLDCRAASPDCPEVVIAGDPVAELPGGVPSPFRGYGDPSLRRDPQSGRLWLSYSHLDLVANGDGRLETGVSIHLAASDDGGATWHFRRALAPSRPTRWSGAPGVAGISVHEVSTLARLPGASGRWFGMDFSYFDPFGPAPREPGSFHLRLARAGRPQGLARSRRARLAGSLVDPTQPIDLDLSTLAAEPGACDVWTEPSLYAESSWLYLVAQCVVVDERGRRRPREEFVGLFATSGRGPVRFLDWRWVGKLTGPADARRLGGDVLTQPDLVRSRDGSLLLLVTPKRLGAAVEHRGCRALELESLEPPRLARLPFGRPVVRADIRSSDSNGLGPGLCAYDPASATGILFVRTEVDLTRPDIVFRLHATGVHP